MLLRTLLDSTIGRILELKHEMVNLDFLEFSFIEDVLSEVKLTPDQIEVPVPKYFKRDRAEEIAYWENQLKEAHAKMGIFQGDGKIQTMSREGALKILQVDGHIDQNPPNPKPAKISQ